MARARTMPGRGAPNARSSSRGSRRSRRTERGNLERGVIKRRRAETGPGRGRRPVRAGAADPGQRAAARPAPTWSCSGCLCRWSPGRAGAGAPDARPCRCPAARGARAWPPGRMGPVPVGPLPGTRASEHLSPRRPGRGPALPVARLPRRSAAARPAARPAAAGLAQAPATRGSGCSSLGSLPPGVESAAGGTVPRRRHGWAAAAGLTGASRPGQAARARRVSAGTARSRTPVGAAASRAAGAGPAAVAARARPGCRPAPGPAA